MRFLSRPAIVLAAIVVLSFGLAGCGPQVAGPHTYERAKQLEKEGKPDQALQVYDAIVRDNQKTNPDKAAQALYDAGIFASDPNRFGKTKEDHERGLNQAWQHWKQLRDEFPDRAQKLLHLGQPDDKLQQIGETLDQHNRSDWKYPFINVLVVATGSKPWFSYWFALVFLAVVGKLLLLPLSKKQYQSQREMQQLMPKIKELQKTYKGTELSQKQMELYKEHGVNPFGGCMPALFQFPFLIFIYAAIRVYEPAFSHGKFLWIGSSLAQKYPHYLGGNLALPDIPLLVIYTLTNYVSMRMSPAPDPNQQQQQNTMALMTSGLFFFMFLNNRWSSAFVLYWLALNAVSIWQTYEYVYKPHKERMKNQPAPEPAAPALPAGDKAERNGVGDGAANGTAPNGKAADGRSAAPKPNGSGQPLPTGRVRPKKKNKR